MSVKIIKPISLGHIDDSKPFEKSLSEKGLTRVPGTGIWLTPSQDTAGRIKTGIDEDSARIRTIIDPEVREKEKAAKLALRASLQERTGLNLEATVNPNGIPESPFYRELFEEGGYKLIDGDNIFNLSNPLEAINFYWICETGIVAKSYEECISGKYPPGRIQFYVFEEDAEAKHKYERILKQDKAVEALRKLTPSELKKIAKLLGLGLPDESITEVVYTKLREYIEMPAASLTKDPIDNFLKFTEMSPESLSIEYLVRRLLDKNIIRAYAGGVVKQGETTLSKSVDQFKLDLADPKNEELRVSLEEKLKQVINNVLV